MDLKNASKTALRKNFRELRKKLSAEDYETLSEKICQRVWEQFIASAGAQVSVGLYFPIDAEVDVRLLAEKLSHEGVPLALPVLDAAPVYYRAIESFRQVEDQLRLQKMPTLPHDLPAAEPTILIVPGVAFSKSGHRLGFGKGFFDRAIHALRHTGGASRATPLCVGVCFGFQLVATLPCEPHDLPMDAIVTEMETLHLNPRL